MGTAEFVQHHTQDRMRKEQALLDWLPKMGDLQCAWLLLALCATPRANHVIRALPPTQARAYALEHDSRIWDTLQQLLCHTPSRGPGAAPAGPRDCHHYPAGSEVWGCDKRNARHQQPIGRPGRMRWKSSGNGGPMKRQLSWRTLRTQRGRERHASGKSRQQQTSLTGKALHRRAPALGPRGVNSLRVPVLQHKKIAGSPNPASGSMVGSFMRAPQEKPSIGSTI